MRIVPCLVKQASRSLDSKYYEASRKLCGFTWQECLEISALQTVFRLFRSFSRVLSSLHSEENSKVLFDGGAVDFLLDLLQSDDRTVLKNCIGALANLIFENEAYQRHLLQRGFIDILARAFRLPYEEVHGFAAKAVLNLAEISNVTLRACVCFVRAAHIRSEESSKALAEGVFEGLAASAVDPDTARTFAEIAGLLIASTARDYITAHGLVETLLRISLGEEPEEDYDIEEGTAAESALSILLQGAERYDAIREYFLPHGLLDQVKRTFVGRALNPITQKSCRFGARLFATLAADERTAEFLFANDFAFVQSMLASKDQDIRVSGVMVLSNLARNEESCKFIVAQGTPQQLLKMLNKYPNDQRLQLHGSGALRNLSLAPDNKQTLSEAGCIDALSKLLSVKNRPIQFSAVSCLRILITSPNSQAIRFLETTALASVVALSEGKMEPVPEEGEADKAADDRVLFEAGRLLAKLCVESHAQAVVAANGVAGIVRLLRSGLFSRFHLSLTRFSFRGPIRRGMQCTRRSAQRVWPSGGRSAVGRLRFAHRVDCCERSLHAARRTRRMRASTLQRVAHCYRIEQF
jgi:hypothetical protein